MSPAHTAETDAFAIAMIVVMISAFGVIALILVTILRNASKRNREVEELIEDIGQEEEKEEAPVAKKSREPWEKDGDWWKK